MKNQAFTRRFGYAWSGLKAAIASEKSLRTQLGFTVLALVGLLVIRPSPAWWALVGLAIGVVLAAELFNTAVETLCDLVEPNHHPAIQRVKDIAAAAVLITSVASLAVAICLLLSELG